MDFEYTAINVEKYERISNKEEEEDGGEKSININETIDWSRMNALWAHNWNVYARTEREHHIDFNQ